MKIKRGVPEHVLVDPRDHTKLAHFNWHHSHNGYYHAYIGGKKVRLHRFIMGAQQGQIVDHINGNRLDNRRCNLRFATKSQNAMNTGLRADNKSGFKGVSWDKKKELWTARIRVGSQYKFLGYFTDPADGGSAYMRAATRYFGDFARTSW